MSLVELIRQDSLSKLGVGNKPGVISFLDSTLGELKKFNYPEYNRNHTFWGKSKRDIYMTEVLYKDELWISSNKIWDILKIKYHLNFDAVTELIKWYIESKHYMDMSGKTIIKVSNNVLN